MLVLVFSFLFVVDAHVQAAGEDPLAKDEFFINTKVDYTHTGVNKQTEAFIGTEGANYGTPVAPQYIAFKLIQYILYLLGTAFLIYMIYGGILILTSLGVEEKIEKGKSIIKNTTIGLLIILSSYGITWAVVWLYTATGNKGYDCTIEPTQSVDHLSGATDYFDGPIDQAIKENCIYK